MNHTRITRSLTALLAALLTLVLLAGSACAEDFSLPTLDQRRTDTAPEDFAGSWSLRWVLSDSPVDITRMLNVDIFSGGTVSIMISDNADYLSYNSTLEDVGDGFIYVPDTQSNGGLYFFLTDEGLLGCTASTENPATVYYLEFNYEILEEQPMEMIIAEQILTGIGEPLTDADDEDYSGDWHAFSCSNENGELFPLYEVDMTMQLTIDGDLATFTYYNGDEENSYESPVAYASGHVEVTDESGEEALYLVACADGSLAMLDDLSAPRETIVFLREDLYTEKTANTEHMSNPKPGEPVAIDSLSSLTGEWKATHLNYFGSLYSARAMSADLGIIIEPDGSILRRDENEFTPVEGRIEDGCLVVADEDGYEYYFILRDGGILIESEDPDDLTYVLYYQRVETLPEF